MPDPTPEQLIARRRQAKVIIDQILHGTPEGRVDPAIAENLRQHLARHVFEPDRALLEHLREQGKLNGFDLDAVFPEDIDT
jgi:hypothetical protein